MIRDGLILCIYVKDDTTLETAFLPRELVKTYTDMQEQEKQFTQIVEHYDILRESGQNIRYIQVRQNHTYIGELNKEVPAVVDDCVIVVVGEGSDIYGLHSSPEKLANKCVIGESRVTYTPE